MSISFSLIDILFFRMEIRRCQHEEVQMLEHLRTVSDRELLKHEMEINSIDWRNISEISVRNLEHFSSFDFRSIFLDE